MSNKSREANADRRAKAKEKWIKEKSGGGQSRISSASSSCIAPHASKIRPTQRKALNALVSGHAAQCDLTSQLKSTLSELQPSFEFMLGLYVHVLESPKDGDLRNLVVCSELIGDKAVNELAALASDRRLTVYHHALLVLGWLGSLGCRTIPELLRICRDGPMSRREPAYQAVVSLIPCCNNMDRATWSVDEQFIVHLFDDIVSHQEWSGRAYTALVALGANAVDHLVCQMQGKSPKRRRMAAAILGEMGTIAATAIPALQEATMHRDDVLRIKARAALKRIQRAL